MFLSMTRLLKSEINDTLKDQIRIQTNWIEDILKSLTLTFFFNVTTFQAYIKNSTYIYLHKKLKPQRVLVIFSRSHC